MKKLGILTTLLPAFAVAAPNAPSSLTFTDVTANSVTINWSDNSSDETGFKIYKDGKLLVKTAPNTTNFLVGELSANKEYTFTVKATDDNFEYNTGKALTRDELKALIVAYGNNPTSENRLAVEKANTSQITDMSDIFNIYIACGDDGVAFDGDISGWDTSNVTNMEHMFWFSKIKELPESFDISNATNVSYMFEGTEITIPENFIKNAKSVDGIFGAQHAKLKLPDNLYTTGRTNFDGLFSGYNDEKMPNIDTSSATSMKEMFRSSNIKELPNNFDTSHVTNMKEMFYGSKITKLPNSFDTSKVTNMEGMFHSSWITKLPDSFNTSNITNMREMFAGSKITELPKNFDTSHVTNMRSMFEYSKLTKLPDNFDTSNVTDMSFMFMYSEQIQLPDSFNTSNVVNMYGMFAGSQITKLPKNFDTSKVTNMGRMFAKEGSGFDGVAYRYCQIEKIPDNFDTSNVTNMKEMFLGNKKTTSLADSFDTSKVTNMEAMFKESAITHIPWFNTSNVTNMIKIFYKTQNFNQDVSGWDVTNVNIEDPDGWAIKQWYWFNKDSSLEDAHIPSKFRD
jgi:surface protein